MRYEFWTPPPWYATREIHQIHPVMFAKELEWQMMLDCSDDDLKTDREAKRVKKEVAKQMKNATRYIRTLSKNGVYSDSIIK